MELPHQAWEEDNWNLIWILDETNIYLIDVAKLAKENH